MAVVAVDVCREPWPVVLAERGEAERARMALTLQPPVGLLVVVAVRAQLVQALQGLDAQDFLVLRA